MDVLHLQLKMQGETPIGGSAVSIEPTVTFWETSFLYTPLSTEQWVIDVHAGIRTYFGKNEMERETLLPPPGENSRSLSSTWVDPIIGAKAYYLPHKHWLIKGRFDIGGFGAGSDFSWQAYVGGGYKFNKTCSILLLYRGLGFDYKSGSLTNSNYFAMDVTLQGFVLDLLFNF